MWLCVDLCLSVGGFRLKSLPKKIKERKKFITSLYGWCPKFWSRESRTKREVRKVFDVSILSPQQPYCVGAIIPISQMKKLRLHKLLEVTQLVNRRARSQPVKGSWFSRISLAKYIFPYLVSSWRFPVYLCPQELSVQWSHHYFPLFTWKSHLSV